MLSMLSAGNDGKAVKIHAALYRQSLHRRAFQAYLDENGDQAIAYYTIFTVN